jgi:hypothetical protein
MIYFFNSKTYFISKKKKLCKENRESNKWNNIQEFRFSFSSPGIFSKLIDYYYSTYTCVESCPCTTYLLTTY